jgi:hypothetical protein
MPQKRLSIKITNASLVQGDLKAELFYSSNSMTDILKSDYVTLNGFAYLPSASMQALPSANLDGLVGFNYLGWCNIHGDVSTTATNYMSIVCPEIPYKTLFEYTKSKSFVIKKMRISANDQAQLLEPFDYLYKDIFGFEGIDTFRPADSIAPEQYQSLIIDVYQEYKIDSAHGLRFNLKANSYVNVVFWIEY